mgnify:CR=1 FL=1
MVQDDSDQPSQKRGHVDSSSANNALQLSSFDRMTPYMSPSAQAKAAAFRAIMVQDDCDEDEQIESPSLKPSTKMNGFTVSHAVGGKVQSPEFSQEAFIDNGYNDADDSSIASKTNVPEDSTKACRGKDSGIFIGLSCMYSAGS